jgi:hypothetical protein
MSRTFQIIAMLSLHPVTAAISLDESDGDSSYSIDIGRRYKDHAGTWRSVSSFSASDLPLVAKIADMAHAEISKLEADDGQAPQAEEVAA